LEESKGQLLEPNENQPVVTHHPDGTIVEDFEAIESSLPSQTLGEADPQYAHYRTGTAHRTSCSTQPQ